MRKEVFYSLAALGMAPVVADAAVVQSGVTLPSDAWSGGEINNNVLIVSNGSEVTQTISSLLPGKYQLFIGTILDGEGNPLTTQKLTVEVKDGETSLGKNEDVKTSEDVVEFEVSGTEPKNITVSVKSTDDYQIARVSLKIDYDFEGVATALQGIAQELTNALTGPQGYKTNINNVYGTQLAGYTTEIEDIANAVNADPANATPKDSVYANIYSKYELWKGGAEESTLYAALMALKANAYSKEQAALAKDSAALVARIADLPDYMKDDFGAERTAIHTAYDEFEEGDASWATQQAIAALETKVAAAEANANAFEQFYTTNIQQAIQAVNDNYAALGAWRDATLEGNDLAGLKAVMTAEMAKEKTAFDAKVAEIEAAYVAGTLLTSLNTAADPVTGTGSWFTDETGYAAVVAGYTTKFSVNNAPADGSLQKAYTTYKTNFAGDGNHMLATYLAKKALYEQAVADSTGFGKGISAANRAKLQEAFGRMQHQWTRIDTTFQNFTYAKEKRSAATGESAEAYYKAGTGKLLDNLDDGVLKGLYGKFATTAAASAATDSLAYYYKALSDINADLLALNNAKSTAIAKYDAVDDALAAFKEAVEALKANEGNNALLAEYLENGYDVKRIWLDGNDTLTYNNFVAMKEKAIDDINAKTAIADVPTADAATTAANSIVAIIKKVFDWTQNEDPIAAFTDADNNTCLLKQAYNEYKALKAKYEGENGWEAKLAQVKTLVEKSMYSDAYNDTKKIAGFYPEYQESYKVQYDSLQSTVNKVRNALTTTATGGKFLAIVNNSEEATALTLPFGGFNWAGIAAGINFESEDAPNAKYPYGKIDAMFGYFLNNTKDAYNNPLLDNDAYAALVTDAATDKLIYDVKAKIVNIMEGVIDIAYPVGAELEGTDEDHNYTDFAPVIKNGGAAAVVLTDEAATVKYGAKGHDIVTAAAALIATDGNALEDLAELTDEDAEGLLPMTATAGDVINDLIDLINKAKGLDPYEGEASTEDLATYSDYLDKLNARLKAIKSDAAAAVARVAANNEFFVTKKEGVTVSGAEISPEDISKIAADIEQNPLYQYFLTKTNAIERNGSYLKYPGLTQDDALREYYQNNKGDIYTPYSPAVVDPDPAPEVPEAGLITELAQEILDAYANETLQQKWDELVAGKETIINRINQLVTFADDAQAAWKAIDDLLGPSGELSAEGLTQKTDAPEEAYTNEYLVAETALKNILGETTWDNDDAPAVAFKAQLEKLYQDIYAPANAEVPGVKAKVEAAFDAVKAELATVDLATKDYEGDIEFDTEEFEEAIDDVVAALNALPTSAKANEDAKKALAPYLGVGLDGVDPVLDIENEYLRIKAKISANDATTAGDNYIIRLDSCYNAFKAIRTDSTGTAAWDKVKANYDNAINPANLAELATKLEELYTKIEGIEEAQEEGFIAAVKADNDALKAKLAGFVATAKAKYVEAVAAQDDTKATQEVLKAAVAKADEKAPQFNADLYGYPTKIEEFEDEVLATETGSFDQWCAANVGKVYPQDKFNADSAKIETYTAEMNTKMTTFLGELTTAVTTAMTGTDGWLTKAGIVNTLFDEAKTKMKNYGLNGVSNDSIKFYFKTELDQYKAVEDKTPAKAGNKFSLKALDDAIRTNLADTAAFVKRAYADFNTVAHTSFDNVIAEAETIYNGGNAAFLGTENEEMWLVSAKKYVSLDSLWDDAVSRENTTEFDKQVGKKYNDIKTKYVAFITDNLQIQTTGAQGAVNMAKADTTVLYKALKDSVALYAGTSYGADGAMQELVDGIKQDIDTLVSKYENKGLAATIKAEKKDSADIHDRINLLYAYQLATEEKKFVDAQMNALKEQYNRMKADGKDSLAAVLKTAIDSIADVIADNKKVTIAKELNNKNKFDAGKRAKNVSSLAVLKAAEDKIAELLKAAAEENGIDTAAVKAELNDAIDEVLAKAQEALENLGENLTDEQKALAEAKIQEAIDELTDLKEAVKESDNPVADEAKIKGQIAAADNKIDLATDQAEKEQGSNAAADEANVQAAQEMLEEGFTYKKGEQDITVKSVAELREAFEDTAEKLADEDVFGHITPELTAGRMQAIEDAIDELQEEIEDALEAGEAVDYQKAKYDDGNNVFDTKGKAIVADLKRVLDFAAQKEAQAYAEDLSDQFDGIYADLGYNSTTQAFTNPGIYTAADFNNLKTAAGKIRQSFVDAKIEEDAETVEYEQVKNGNTITNIGLEALLKKADKIQTRIDSLQEQMAALAMGEVEEVIGDVDGDGVVTDDDVDAFLAALAAGDVPAKSDAAFDIYDVNGDGKINIADAQGILNLSIGLNVDGTDPADEAAAARKSESLTGNITAETTQLENGAQRIVLTLDANFEYTGFQLDVQGAEVLSEKSQNMTLKTGNMKNGAHRILGFNFGMPQGNGQVIAIDVQGNAQLGTITFTTANAQAISFKLSGTTGIYGITTESSNVFYDLSGKLVKGMKKGVNIIRDAAGKAKKAIMK